MIEITKEQLKDSTSALLNTTTQMLLNGTWKEHKTLFESYQKTYDELKAILEEMPESIFIEI